MRRRPGRADWPLRPSRIKVPLKRTNPPKGIGVAPKWQEISWETALEILTDRLTKVREKDPRRLLISHFDHIAGQYFMGGAWALAFGTPNHHWTGYYCGNYLHSSMYLTNGSFHSDFDLDYCNYAILLGNQQDFMGGLNANVTVRKMAEARQRGMRVVVVDPVGTNAAAKSDEWVPIRPGTNGDIHFKSHQCAGERARLLRSGIFESENQSFILNPAVETTVIHSRRYNPSTCC